MKFDSAVLLQCNSCGRAIQRISLLCILCILCILFMWWIFLITWIRFLQKRIFILAYPIMGMRLAIGDENLIMGRITTRY